MNDTALIDMEGSSKVPTPSQALYFDVSHPMYMQLINGHAIRLLELAPSENEDAMVSLTLSIHELEHAPPFDAVSYVWGDDTQRRNIRCNNKMLSVTQSLESALRRVRLTDTPRLLWADAICINQGDKREKSHHVAFMCEVYRQARHVLLYMGPDRQNAANDIVALVKEHSERSAPYHGKLKPMPKLDDDDPVLRDSRWKSLAYLLSRPWWSRAWVIQEAGVATNPVVLFGSVEINYRMLTRLLRWIVGRASQLQTEISLLTIHTDWEQWSKTWYELQDYPFGVVDLLSHAKGLGCREPRDHIYALLGHPLLRKNDGSEPVIPSDYTIPHTVVFRRLTEWLVRHVGLFSLCAIEHDEETILDPETPSWVIRWDMDIVQNSFGYYQPFYYNASRMSAAENIGGTSVIRYEANLAGDGCLNLFTGPVHAVIDVRQFSAKGEDWTVEKASLALQHTEELRNLLTSIRDMVFDPDSSSVYSRSSMADALSLTLAAGLRDWEPAEEELELHRIDRDAFWRLFDEAIRLSAGEQTLVPDESNHASGAECANRFFYNLSLACKGRCFYVTDGGYWGVGPWIMKKGDHIRVVRGLRVPLALRPVSALSTKSRKSSTDDMEGQDDQAYKLLGESYMHGAMDGELVTENSQWTKIRVL